MLSLSPTVMTLCNSSVPSTSSQLSMSFSSCSKCVLAVFVMVPSLLRVSFFSNASRPVKAHQICLLLSGLSINVFHHRNLVTFNSVWKVQILQ